MSKESDSLCARHHHLIINVVFCMARSLKPSPPHFFGMHNVCQLIRCIPFCVDELPSHRKSLIIFSNLGKGHKGEKAKLQEEPSQAHLTIPDNSRPAQPEDELAQLMSKPEGHFEIHISQEHLKALANRCGVPQEVTNIHDGQEIERRQNRGKERREGRDIIINY
jgi:hypothetical protein